MAATWADPAPKKSVAAETVAPRPSEKVVDGVMYAVSARYQTLAASSRDIEPLVAIR